MSSMSSSSEEASLKYAAKLVAILLMMLNYLSLSSASMVFLIEATYSSLSLSYLVFSFYSSAFSSLFSFMRI